MKEIKDFFSMVASLDGSCTELRDLQAAMQIFDEALEADGFQAEDSFEEWKAINFGRRFHLYLSTFRIIFRDFARIIDEMEGVVDLMYTAHKSQTVDKKEAKA